MSCQYCDLKLNLQFNWDNINISCKDCGNTVYWSSIFVKYKYKNKGEHHFDIIKPYFCAECNMEVNEAIIPCGGSYYFKESDVSESLLLPQEFIKNK